MGLLLEKVLFALFGIINVVIVTNSYDCLCPCSKVGDTVNYLIYNNMTAEEILVHFKNKLENVQEDIKVDPKETALYRNKRLSAEDDRTSSAVIGWFGGVMIAIPFVLCFLSDMCRCSRVKRNKNV